MGMPDRDDSATAGCCSLPRESVGVRRPTLLGYFYSDWVLNVLERFVADAHHRGILCRLPEKVVENSPRLGLEYLLEGGLYQVNTVQQLIRTQGEYDWSSWGQKGYHLVGGVPFHLVGTEHLIQDLSPVEVIKIMGPGDGDDVEEVLAQGSVPVLRKTTRLGERDDPTGVKAFMALQFNEPIMGNPRVGYGAGVRRLEFQSAPSQLTGLGAPTGPQDADGYVSMPSVPRLGYRMPAYVPLYPTGEGMASQNTAPSMGEKIHSSYEV
jgi:hypothetical protein